MYDLFLVFLQLGDKRLCRIKLPFFAQSFHKGDADRLTIKITFEVENIHLKRLTVAMKRWTIPYIHHRGPGRLLSVDHCPYRIGTRCRNQLIGMISLQVGCRVT